MKLSIIVPIYNTPKDKLKRCLEAVKSIQSQSCECILVDDGSDQETRKYLNEYVESNSSYKYIRKENGGVSSARNVGIERALGEYICFADADDKIKPDVIDYFISQTYEDDIIFTDLIYINKKNQKLWKVYDGKEITCRKILKKMFESGNINGPFCKFIKKSFLDYNKIRFQEKIVTAEDRVFLLDMLLQKPTIAYIDKASYFYYREETSGKNRLKTYCDRFYSNYEEVYRRELLCISSYDLSLKEREFLKVCAAKLYISNIFNVTLELTEIGIKLQKMEMKIINAANYIDIDNMDLKTMIRRELLLKKHWKMLKIIAFIRRKYLRAKGLI